MEKTKAATDTAGSLQYVKMLSWSLFFLILGATLALSVFLSSRAETSLLEKQKQFGLLLAENLNHQVYTRFTLPMLIKFGRIGLTNPEQADLLDQVVRTTIHSFHVHDLRVYGLDKRVVYSLDKNLVGKEGLAGQHVTEAFTGVHSFEILSNVSTFAALFSYDLKPGSMVLRGYYPMRAERTLGGGSDNPLMGILEFTQDITDEYVGVLNLQRLFILSSCLTAMVLFGIIVFILRRVERMNLERLAERERLERELLQQEKLAGMGRMVAGVAHEIRNPLGIICSSAELVIKRTKDETDPNARILKALYDEAKRLSRTVADFLDYARPKQPRMDPVDISQILEQAVVFLENECAKHGVTVVRDYPPGMVVRGDKDLLYRAVYNVISNAIQAMTDGGRLRIRGLAGDGKVELAFTDTGPGFDPESIDKLKDPFFTTKDNGTGLGLAIVNSILESHGAQFNLSCGLEGGARVDMVFPAG